MILYSNYVERLYKKVKTVGMISRSYIKNVKIYGFSKLIKNSCSLKPQISVKEPNETQTFEKKLKEMQSEI